MRKIALTKGKFALVDEMDFKMLSMWKWQYANGYAVHQTHAAGKSVSFKMHRVIIGAKPGEIVDHIDGNGLNNQRKNLRVVPRGTNAQNHGGGVFVEGFKGVLWVEKRKKYRAQISHNKKRILLGMFEDPMEAARAYDAAALKYYGPNAATNSKILAKKLRTKKSFKKDS